MEKLIEAITTTTERDLLMDFLEQLSQIIFKKTMDVKSFIVKNAPENMKDILLQTFENSNLGIGDGAIVEIENLERSLRDMPVASISIGFLPSYSLARAIKEWFRKEMSQTVLLEFKKDNGIIGGAVVESGGRRVEYSFRQYFKAKEADGSESLLPGGRTNGL